MSLFDRIQIVTEKIQKSLDLCNRKDKVVLVAATKNQNLNTVAKCINSGIINIGENRVQEAEQKFEHLNTNNKKIVKRMIGHLQSNKLNKALTLFDAIDSIDTIELAKKIAYKTAKTNTQIQALLEVNTSKEKSKFGFNPEDSQGMLESIELNNINIKGLMTLGPNTNNEKTKREAFELLRNIKEDLNRQIQPTKQLTELSMGMSGDFDLAIQEGSTMVRLGTALFGRRKQ